MGTEVEQSWRWTRADGVAAQVERLLYGGAVGLMGGFAALWMLHGKGPFAAIALLAIALCAVAGFLFVEVSLRDDEPSHISFGGRAALFVALNSVGIAIYWVALLDLTQRGVGDMMVIAVICSAIVVVWNFLLNLALTWKL